MSDKKVLIKIDNVRIKEYDSMNVTVERFEVVYNPKEKKREPKWVLKGYSRGIYQALQKIIRDELLINQDEINSLQDYIYKVGEANRKLLAAVENRLDRSGEE